MPGDHDIAEEELSATQVDAQRARNLLDRALGLSERGDLSGAIVVCRQALALAPRHPQAWSMLGLLYERNDEIDSAIEAYGKVLELSPSSTLERESLQRLRQRRGARPRPAPTFRFDELHEDGVTPNAAPAPQNASTTPLEDNPDRWNIFYFRSLPLALAALGCLLILVSAQRAAFQRQHSQPAPVAPPQPVAASAPAPSVTQVPAVTPAAPTETPANSPPPQNPQDGMQIDMGAPAPRPAPPRPTVSPVPRPAAPAASPRPAPPRPRPSPRPRPQGAPPAEMPVLPAPRLTLPQRPAPQPTESASNPAPARPAARDDAPAGNGPLDVGDSEDSKYILIKPPTFPNADRH